MNAVSYSWGRTSHSVSAQVVGETVQRIVTDEGMCSPGRLVVTEVAEQLSVTEETVRRWLRIDRLEGTRLSRRAGWRIRQSAVDQLLEELFQEGKLAA